MHILHPKLALLGVAAAGLAIPSLRANILAYDSFETGPDPLSGQYTSGISVGAQDPTIPGFTGAWIIQNGGNEGAVNVISPASLDYSSPGYATSGGSVAQQVDNGRYGRLFDSNNPFAVSDTTFYMSFLLQASANGGYVAFELNDSSFQDSTRSFQLGLSSFGDFGPTGNFAFRINNNGSLVGDFGSFDTDAHLFVVKFDLSSVALGDSVTAWMDPTLGAGDPSGGITLSGFDLSTTDLIALATFGGPQAGYDEIRLGTTFDDVTIAAVPEPRSVALLIGGLCVATSVARSLRRRRRRVA